MQRPAIKRLPAAHLALAGVSLAGLVAVVWSGLEQHPLAKLPEGFSRAVAVERIAAGSYLIATTLFALTIVVGRRAIAQRLLKSMIALEGLLVLASAAVLIRGHSSRGLLAGLDVLLPAVVVVAVMSIAVAVATRHESTYVEPGPSTLRSWLGGLLLVRIASCLALVAVLAYLETQPLPNAVVQ